MGESGGGDTVHPAVSRGPGISPGTWTGVRWGWGRAQGLGESTSLVVLMLWGLWPP